MVGERPCGGNAAHRAGGFGISAAIVEILLKLFCCLARPPGDVLINIAEHIRDRKIKVGQHLIIAVDIQLISCILCIVDQPVVSQAIVVIKPKPDLAGIAGKFDLFRREIFGIRRVDQVFSFPGLFPVLIPFCREKGEKLFGRKAEAIFKDCER